jgi:hypothetical protein
MTSISNSLPKSLGSRSRHHTWNIQFLRTGKISNMILNVVVLFIPKAELRSSSRTRTLQSVNLERRIPQDQHLLESDKMTFAPPAKKRKTESHSKAPIMFHGPGLKPGVCLKVFDQDFYVHSIILKVHSESSRKFLDSPDKAVGEKRTTGFCYVWVTEVDKDRRGWHLIAAPSPESQVCHSCRRSLLASGFIICFILQ